MLVTNPEDHGAFSLLAKAHAQKGDFQTAVQLMEKAPSYAVFRAAFLAKAGRSDQAHEIVEKFTKSPDAKKSPYLAAQIYASIGEREKAFAWLEKSYEMRQADLVSLKVDPDFDSIRDDARYADLLRRINLAD